MFREYDVRGVYGREVTEQNFFKLGVAFNKIGKQLIAGMDYRPHNQGLLNAFLNGFEGETFFLGIAPTPATAFCSKKRGVSITASHNPSEYAGAKFIKEKRCFFTEELNELKKEYEKIREAKKLKKKLLEEKRELLEGYLNSLPEIKEGVFDLCGGAACAVKKIFPKTIFSIPDPLFKKHSPEPKQETLEEFRKKSIGAKEVGFAFDGDADRVIVCDNGKVVDGCITTAFLLQIKKVKKITVTIDFSQEVIDFIKESGVQVTESVVGDVNVVKKILEENSGLGAERSGHYYWSERMPYSDGIYAAALLSGTKPGELLDFAQQFKNIVLTDQEYVKINFNKLKQLAEEKAVEVITVDGVKAVYEEFTILVRQSKTEPKIRVQCEARGKKTALKGMNFARKLISSSQIQ